MGVICHPGSSLKTSPWAVGGGRAGAFLPCLGYKGVPSPSRRRRRRKDPRKGAKKRREKPNRVKATRGRGGGGGNPEVFVAFLKPLFVLATRRILRGWPRCSRPLCPSVPSKCPGPRENENKPRNEAKKELTSPFLRTTGRGDPSSPRHKHTYYPHNAHAGTLNGTPVLPLTPTSN